SWISWKDRIEMPDSEATMTLLLSVDRLSACIVPLSNEALVRASTNYLVPLASNPHRSGVSDLTTSAFSSFRVWVRSFQSNHPCFPRIHFSNQLTRPPSSPSGFADRECHACCPDRPGTRSALQ